MAEFQEVMKIQKRICDYYKGECSKCTLSISNNGFNYFCDEFRNYCPQQAEEIILHWAEEHPVQTNADKFKEVFGFGVEIGRGCYGIHCPNVTKCAECEYKGFWQQEYKEPKGE